MENNNIVIMTIDGKDYKCILDYNSLKLMKAKFGMKIADIDYEDVEDYAKVIHCCIKDQVIKFTHFEKELTKTSLANIILTFRKLQNALEIEEDGDEEKKPVKENDNSKKKG